MAGSKSRTIAGAKGRAIAGAESRTLARSPCRPLDPPLAGAEVTAPRRDLRGDSRRGSGNAARDSRSSCTRTGTGAAATVCWPCPCVLEAIHDGIDGSEYLPSYIEHL